MYAGRAPKPSNLFVLRQDSAQSDNAACIKQSMDRRNWCVYRGPSWRSNHLCDGAPWGPHDSYSTPPLLGLGSTQASAQVQIFRNLCIGSDFVFPMPQYDNVGNFPRAYTLHPSGLGSGMGGVSPTCARGLFQGKECKGRQRNPSKGSMRKKHTLGNPLSNVDDRAKALESISAETIEIKIA